MKRTLFLMAFAVAALWASAQAPEAFKYQAVIRDASNQVIANTAFGVKINIMNSLSTTVYSETHSVTTSPFGLVNLNIGAGTFNSNTFSAIDWSTDTYSINVEVDARFGLSKS